MYLEVIAVFVNLHGFSISIGTPIILYFVLKWSIFKIDHFTMKTVKYSKLMQSHAGWKKVKLLVVID